MKQIKSIASVFFVVICLLTMAGSQIDLPLVKAVSGPKSPDAKQEEIGAKKENTDNQSSAPVERETSVSETNSRKITLSFVGDCLIATSDGTTHRVGSLNWMADNKPATYFFENVVKIFKSDDFTIANCENVFTDKVFTPILKQRPAFWFRSNTKNASIFKSGAVDIVSIANNHTGDYGKDGFTDTVNALESAGIKVGYSNEPVIVTKNGIKVAFIFEELWYYSQYSRIVNQIKEIEDETDLQIVYFHGGMENIHQPEEWKKNAVRKIIDANADMVIGSHPHVLQPIEFYNDVPIVYSLGNFVYGGNRQPENRTIILKASFEVGTDELKVSTDIIPCYVYTGNTNNWQPDIIEDENDKSKVLDFMTGTRELPY